MTTAAFEVGREVGRFGRWFRLIVGVYFTLLLTAVPFIQHPVPARDIVDFALETGAYVFVIALAYLIVFYLIGERLLAWANPWLGTLIFLGPLGVIAAFGLGPPAFGVALGIYINLSLIVTFAISYGGCEVVALPTLLLRRRYTIYCPYNAVDAVENAFLSGPAGRRLFAIIATATTILVGTYYIAFSLMDLGSLLNWSTDGRWALGLLVPVAYLLHGAWLNYRAADGAAGWRAPLNGGLVLLLLTAILVLRLDWSPFWALLMVVGALYAIARLVRRDRPPALVN